MKATEIRSAIGTIVSIALMVVALWAWQAAAGLSSDASRPDVERWAVRSAAVAVAAIAQVVILTFVANRLYRRRGLAGEMLRVSAGVVAAIALVSAVALGLAGR